MKMRLALVSALLVTLSCTNQKLVPITGDKPVPVDDLLELDAQFCTRPAADVAFPVKLMLVVDTSGSMQFTDQPGLRVNAVRQLINSLRAQSNVFVSTMGFGSNVYLQPEIVGPTDPIFQPVSEWTEPPFISIKDVTTDYQGALDAAKQLMLLDMLRSTAAELSRTKYVILFFSDGSPQPKCCIDIDETPGSYAGDPYNCPLEPWEIANPPAPDARMCEANEEVLFCNDTERLDFFRDNVQGVVGGSGQPNLGTGSLAAVDKLEINSNYNRNYQITGLVQDIMDLGEQFGVGEIQVNTALLYDDNLGDGVKQIFDLNKCRAVSLLQDMADIGHGQFRDFASSESIDFLSFNFTSLKQSFTLVDAYVVNKNALPPGGDPAVIDFRADSDGDGLDDDQEFDLGTNATVADSDNQVEPQPANIPPQVLQDPKSWGDGFNDKLEHDREGIGFDPRFQKRPLAECSPTEQFDGVDRTDLDGDGLDGCEEHILHTDPKLADTDGDSIIDGIEVRIGLDPLVAEDNHDTDFDGTPNLEELRKGRDPLVPDDDREQSSIRYELVEDGHTEDGRTCYTSKVRGIHLATTQPRFTGGRRGYNDILFFIAEAPVDNPLGLIDTRVGCTRVQYVKPNFKDPAQGIVEISEDEQACADDPLACHFKDLGNPAVIDAINNKVDFCEGLEVK